MTLIMGAVRDILDKDRRFGRLKIHACVAIVQVSLMILAWATMAFWQAITAMVFITLGCMYAWLRVRAEPYRYVVPLNIDVERLSDEEYLANPDNLSVFPLLGRNRFAVVLTGREVEEVKATSFWLRLLHRG